MKLGIIFLEDVSGADTWEIVALSFRPQRVHRIYDGRSPCWHVRRNPGDRYD